MRKRTALVSIITLGVAGAAAYGWMTIRRGFSARENPSAMEADVARMATILCSQASA